MGGETPVAGNTRTGRLFHLGSGNYSGERIAKGGRFETKRWNGLGKREAIERWQEWRAETHEEATISVSMNRNDKKGEVGLVAAPKTKQTEEKRASVSLLIFKGGRSQKTIAAYADTEAALRMATALEMAAEVSGQDGEYEVDEVPLWE